jgi:hypothetical protein
MAQHLLNVSSYPEQPPNNSKPLLLQLMQQLADLMPLKQQQKQKQ